MRAMLRNKLFQKAAVKLQGLPALSYLFRSWQDRTWDGHYHIYAVTLKGDNLLVKKKEQEKIIGC